MTQQEEVRFNNLREMFNSEGWKEFIKDIDAILLPRVEHAVDICQTNDTWQVNRGEVNILRQIKGYQDLIEATQAQLEEEEGEDAQL